jgi:beta-galactosidase
VIKNNTLVRDGSPLQILSGSLHYHRCHPALWRDRLKRMRAMGLNTISSYIPWTFHETEEGVFNFEGDRNITKFVLTAQEEGLMVMLRMGPYMCGETDFGGLPWWLLHQDPHVTIRTFDPGFISFVGRYWAQLLPQLKPLLWSNGGPVVMAQVENEYGSYGDVSKNSSDLKYIEYLIDLAHMHLGEGAVVLYTTDGGNKDSMQRGSVNGSVVYTVGDHGPGNRAVPSACAHIHALTYTCNHSCTHALTHALHSCTHALTHTRTHTRTYTRIHSPTLTHLLPHCTLHRPRRAELCGYGSVQPAWHEPVHGYG